MGGKTVGGGAGRQQEGEEAALMRREDGKADSREGEEESRRIFWLRSPVMDVEDCRREEGSSHPLTHPYLGAGSKPVQQLSISQKEGRVGLHSPSQICYW